VERLGARRIWEWRGGRGYGAHQRPNLPIDFLNFFINIKNLPTLYLNIFIITYLEYKVIN
jgi:hypothetical protein